MSNKKETPGRSSDIIYDKEFSQEMIEEEDFYNDFGAEASPPKGNITKQKTSHQIDQVQLNHMNEAQLKNFNSLNQNRVLSDSGQPKPIEKKKLKSEHNNRNNSSSKSPGGVFIGTKTIGSNLEKNPPTISGRKKTPAVSVQHDIYSYDILNGN